MPRLFLSTFSNMSILLSVFLVTRELLFSAPSEDSQRLDYSTFNGMFKDDQRDSFFLPIDTFCYSGALPPSTKDLPAERTDLELRTFLHEETGAEIGRLRFQTKVHGPKVSGIYLDFNRVYSMVGPDEDRPGIVEKITLVWDRTPPELSGVPPNQILPDYTEIPAWPEIKVNDESPKPLIIPTSQVIEDQSGSKLIRTWTAIDRCGNSIVASQSITIMNEHPLLLQVPADTIIQSGEAIPAPKYSLSEYCTAVQVELKEIVDQQIECEYRLRRIWTVRLAGDEVVRDTQSIRIIDTIAPTITMADSILSGVISGNEIVIHGDINEALLTEGDLHISDQCCTPICVIKNEWITKESHDYGDCERWRCRAIATDSAGNRSEFIYYILHFGSDSP